MPEPLLGKLARVDPKTVWAHEAREFTPWLAKHLSLLNEALALDIELTGTEMAVGNFAVDIFGKELGSGHEVIIENQLLPTDHSHLGQLLTYAAGLDAKIVIWISPQFRDEHKQALDWLNRQTPETVSFFGVELHVFRIEPAEESDAVDAGSSLQAPHFEVVAQPSHWQEEIVTAARGTASGRRAAYHEFFSELVERIHARAPGFTNIRRIGYDNWIHFAVGRGGFVFSVSFATGNRFRVELEVDTGDHEKNRIAFERLAAERDVLESVLGPLVWDFKEGRRAQRIYSYRDASIDSPDEVLTDLKEWAMDTLQKYRQVLTPRVKALVLDESSE